MAKPSRLKKFILPTRKSQSSKGKKQLKQALIGLGKPRRFMLASMRRQSRQLMVEKTLIWVLSKYVPSVATLLKARFRIDVLFAVH